MAHYPRKPVPGDRVAVVSPSAGLPEILPLPYELGLARLREDFGLVPIEYPSTRRMGSSPADRAADLHAAFADPSVKAVISSIGGDDQLTVLPYLDRKLLQDNPKPFFGFSDCTNLLALLADIGIVGYHGGAVMTAFGRPGSMHPATEDSLRAALFGTGTFELRDPGEYRDIDRDWADPATFEAAPEMSPSPGWEWRGSGSIVTGHGWGGCLEVVSWLLMADRCVPDPEWFDGAVLFFETSEEMPEATEVYRILRSIGERGILGRCAAVLMGRPKSRSLNLALSAPDAEAFRAEQREAVVRALDEYNPGVPAVLGVDFGHTDPQLVLPYCGTVRVDVANHHLSVDY
ncbi:S66 family peptidase [Glycomyces buryatensis]|uniref:LD-carboxypeptidase n=1 Tax=Glycomyces buryatensis TaxID=2570927 RepID=A0A4S8PXC6_9ACTN|nr:S66 peptidase family protein [Glycomyces buryatensis]THV36353.1 LD-carboxypeptidase [Glycomyces buryatensis]